MRQRSILGSIVPIVVVGLTLVLLYGPLLALAVFSFNDSISIALPLEGFTTKWYTEAFQNRLVRESLMNSLLLASITTPISLVLGTLGAIGITRFWFRGRTAATALLSLPLLVPWLLTAMAALLYFKRLDISLGLWTVGTMHVVVAFPLVVVILAAQLHRFDRTLEEAAQDLGANRRTVLRLVILPHIAPALGAAAILAFSVSFNNFVISFFNIGFDLTFPIWVFSALRHAQNLPIINAISTLVGAIQVVLLFVAWQLLKLRRDPSAREALATIGVPTPDAGDSR